MIDPDFCKLCPKFISLNPKSVFCRLQPGDSWLDKDPPNGCPYFDQHIIQSGKARLSADVCQQCDRCMSIDFDSGIIVCSEENGWSWDRKISSTAPSGCSLLLEHLVLQKA